MIRYIRDEQHNTLLMNEISKVKHTLRMGTADLKDLYIKQGVSIRLLHAKEPGENFKNDFDKYPLLWEGLERSSLYPDKNGSSQW